MSEEVPKKKSGGRPKLDGAPTRSLGAKPGHGEGLGDAVLKQKVLEAALPNAAFDGFTDPVLAKAGAAAGVKKAELERLFPEGGRSLIETYSLSVDAEMEELLAEMDLSKMKIRQRIAAAVLARLSILKPNKEAARR